jgi:transglutaminase-like putative cysteine protease
MLPVSKPFLTSARIAAALGFLSLSLTGEMTALFIAFIWMVYSAGFWLDARTGGASNLSRFDVFAVGAMIAAFLVDFFLVRNTVFICIAHFLAYFQAYKLLGFKGRRDVFQILLFGFFQILAACTLSLEVWHAFIFLALIPVATLGLFWHLIELHAEEYGTRPSADDQGAFRRLSRGMAIAAVPMNLALTAVVFVLFPRLTFNATLPGMGNNRMGFTDQVNLTRTGSLEGDASVTMWLRIPEEQRKLWNGYLRGTTMSQFDGRRWTPRRENRARMLPRDGNGVFRVTRPIKGLSTLHASVTLLNPSAMTLFSTGIPYEVVTPVLLVRQDSDGSLHWGSRWDRPLRYELLTGIHPEIEWPVGWPAEASMAEYLELPVMDLSKVAAHAARAVGLASSPEARARAIATYLQTNFRYSTDMGSQASENPVEDFLEVRKSGPCGHFASAMAVMLRLEKIPCRIVAGYLRGEFNEPAQQYVVRERDAHAWVEAYIPQRGWIRFDPSPRQGPEQVAAGRRWFQKARQYWDYVGLTWDRLVIDYDLYAQLRAFERVRNSSENASESLGRWWAAKRRGADERSSSGTSEGPELPMWLVLLTTAGVLALTWAASRRVLAKPAERAVQDYQRFLRKMARQGLSKRLEETPHEFLARIQQSDPSLHPAALQATQRYARSRYETAASATSS